MVSASAPVLTGTSPLDGKALREVPTATPEDVRVAVQRARSAQIAWGARALKQRVAPLRQAAKNMLADRQTIIELMRDEAGKLEVDGLMSEALGPLDQVNNWAKVAARALDTRRVSLNPIAFPKKSARYRLVPRGVVGCITPWNYPIATFFRPVLPALMAGNGVVVKPSEHTPRSAQWFLGHLQRELPPDLLAVVQGRGDVGEALVEAGIDACTFTGSVATGKRVLELCAKRLIPCNVELGGNDAALLLEDCDMDRAVQGITHWALHNAGQACGAVEIALVPSAIADTFVDRISAAWAKLSCAPGKFAHVDVSPLTLESQLETVERHVEQAVSAGAVLRTGGKRTGHGLGYEPTVLDRCTTEMTVVQEETFGPVLAVVRFDHLDEAIRIVNECKYGLTASVWTRDTARGARVGERLGVGVVSVNNHSLSGAMTGLPWSGTRSTGFGVSNSELAFATFARPLATIIDENTSPEPFWLPFDEDLYELGHLLAEAQLGRIARAWKLPGLLRRRSRTITKFFR